MSKKEERSTWGSKRKRGENSWELRYPLPHGAPGRETFHGTAREADRRLAELRIQYEGANSNITLDQFWRTFYLPEILDNLAPSTIDGYKRVYAHDVEPVFGDYILTDITARNIQDWLLSMPKATAKHAKAVLSSILSRAFVLDFVEDNVAQRRYRYPQEAKRERSAASYTQVEMDEIYHAARGEIWEPAYILAAFGGASREESMSPLLDEISWDGDYAVIPIVRGIQRINGEIIIHDKPKNKYRAREIIIAPPYSRRLREIVNDYRSRGYLWLMDDGFGNVLCPNNVANGSYKRWFIGKPYRYVPFGNLRKSYAAAMNAKGVDGMVISNMLGHNQLSTTYAHYDQLQRDQKIGLLGKLMGNDAHNCPLQHKIG